MGEWQATLHMTRGATAATVAAALLASCTAPLVVTAAGEPGKGTSTSAGRRAANPPATRLPATGPAAAPPSSATATPASASTSPSAPGPATPTISGSTPLATASGAPAASGEAPAREAGAERVALAARLAPLAHVGHAAATVQLVSDRGAGILGNNGVSLVPLGGGNIVANNGTGAVSNGGASLVGNNTGAYRLRGLALLAVEAGALGARPGEQYLGRAARPDGASVDSYAVGTTETRDVVIAADGQRLQEEHTTEIVYHANDNFRTGRTVRRLYGPDGAEHAVLTYRESYDEVGHLSELRYEPSTFRVPGTPIDLAIEAFTLDVARGQGAYHLRFRHLKLEERGTIAQVARRSDGAIAINMADPLDLAGGESRVTDEAGATRYARTLRLADDGQHQAVDLGDGWALALVRRSPQDPFRGTVQAQGREAGAVAFVREATGGLSIRVEQAGNQPVLEIRGQDPLP